jgi:hypothetical protein
MGACGEDPSNTEGAGAESETRSEPEGERVPGLLDVVRRRRLQMNHMTKRRFSTKDATKSALWAIRP